MIEGNKHVSHPGVYVKDAIEALGLSQSEFALRSGLSIKNVSTLCSGESNITLEVATKLASFFGNSVEGWINLQTRYGVFLNEENRRKEYERDYEIAKTIDRSFIRDCLNLEIDPKNKEKTVDSLRKAFGVGALYNLRHPDIYAFCKSAAIKDISEKNIILRNAWISLAEIRARDIKCSKFDREAIIASLPLIRSLTKEDPSIFLPKLMAILNATGVKLVILPYLSGSNIGGVTKWIAQENCVMVAINDCGKEASRIWFALAHELGHVMNNHKRHMTISYEKGKIEDKEEREADNFARKTFLDDKAYEDFVKERRFSIDAIEAFSNKEGVADFMVIGRLKKDGYLPWSAFQEHNVYYEVI